MTRAVVAYLAAIVFGAVICAVTYFLFALLVPPHRVTDFWDTVSAAIFWLPVLGLTASPLAALGVSVARSLGTPRPATDILFGAAVSTTIWATLQLWLFESSFGNAFALSAFALPPGAIAGYAYWRLAGRPRPPYA